MNSNIYTYVARIYNFLFAHEDRELIVLDLRKIIPNTSRLPLTQTKPASSTLSRVDAPTGEIRRGPECNSLKGPIVNKLSRGEDRLGVPSRRFCLHEIPTAMPAVPPRAVPRVLDNHMSRQFINPPTAEAEATRTKGPRRCDRTRGRGGHRYALSPPMSMS